MGSAGPTLIVGLSTSASAVLEAEFAGVDILKAESGGCYVSEVNGILGWKGLQETTKRELAAMIVKHVMRFAGCTGSPCDVGQLLPHAVEV